MAKKKAGALPAMGAKPANPQNNTKTGKRTLPKAAEPFKFKPGVSGNPGGRPKNDIAAVIARAIFEGNIEAITRALLKKIKKGDPRTFTALADRGYGKAPQSVEVTGSDRGPVRVEFVNVDGLAEA